MDSIERMTRRLRGEPVDRPPNFSIVMTFAAHYCGYPLARYYLDHRVLVEANLRMVEDFSIDLVQAISDPYRETTGFGAEIEFPPDGLPVSREPLLVHAVDLRQLTKPDPVTAARMLDRLEAIRLLRTMVGRSLPVMGWVEGGLAQAGDLRGTSRLLLDLIDRPDWVEELLEICTEVEIAFARAQVEAGAALIGVGDALASQISPAMYRLFALPYEKRIIEAVHSLGALTRLHICGDTTRLLPDVVTSGADIIDLDWMVDIGKAAEVVGDRAALCGNMNPVSVMLQGTPDQVYRATIECLHWGGPRSISAAGCEIPDGTPHGNLNAQSRALRDWIH